MGQRKRHHIVSRGYQRLFADGERIHLIDKSTLKYKPAGTRDAFWRKHFNSYRQDGQWSDELEDEWQIRENLSLPAARRIANRKDKSDDRELIKVLVAVHYSRSYVMDMLIQREFDRLQERFPTDMAASDRLHAKFTEQYGRDPDVGELEALANERVAALIEGRSFNVEQMAEGFNKTLEILEPFHVQLVWPQSRQLHFLFADMPVTHSHDDGRIGGLGGVALGDATQIYLPLSPWALILFTHKPFADCPLVDHQVVQLNRRTWDGAVRFLGAHPDTKIGRSLGRWDVRWAG